MIEPILQFLSNSEYVDSFHVATELNSVYKFNIKASTTKSILVVSNAYVHKERIYATLMTDDFSLRFDGKTLTLTGVNDTLESIADPNITEEWFFQQSTVKNYGTLSYEEITFVKDAFASCLIQGD